KGLQIPRAAARHIVANRYLPSTYYRFYIMQILKILSVFFLFLVQVNAQDQIGVVEMYLGGNYLSMSSTISELNKIKKNTSNPYSFNYSVKHFISNAEIMLGYRVSRRIDVLVSSEYFSPVYSTTTNTPNSEELEIKKKYKYSITPISIGARLNLYEILNKLNPYIEVGYTYYHSKETTSSKGYNYSQIFGYTKIDTSVYVKGNGWGYSVATGIRFNFKSQFSILMRLKYRIASAFSDEKDQLKIHPAKQMKALGEISTSKPLTKYDGFCFAIGLSYNFLK
ncbi:MAG TPA: outer membrane beta-barrel protein, partial [bacterium]|nr:outer membrane beta-barrel protein [bacterium]HMZ04634.1 outer membrane beta-barrel protein [bacterium]HNB09790.1 outer membrane beta-barrel protein [bacterium]HNO92256.1 outer membrane beta-barrel protein [bacterium]